MKAPICSATPLVAECKRRSEPVFLNDLERKIYDHVAELVVKIPVTVRLKSQGTTKMRCLALRRIWSDAAC